MWARAMEALLDDHLKHAKQRVSCIEWWVQHSLRKPPLNSP
ncbi:13617_t:CDS:2, partial [Acaulospora colombiana]